MTWLIAAGYGDAFYEFEYSGGGHPVSGAASLFFLIIVALVVLLFFKLFIR